jgi:uncharacterized repeat protein (TIGR02543 family)
MFYAKHRSRRKKMKFVKGIAMLLCLVTIFTSVWVGNLGIGAEDGDRSETVKITVNYVYKSNNAMVAQPYTAQIEKGASFKKTLEVPKLFNYSIPNDEAIGLGTDSIVLTKDEATGKYSLAFDLQSVNENVEVTLYYVAGTAKYTVYHYYQNLENDEYTLDPKTVELTGDIDAYTQAVANNKQGYHCKGIPQTTIAADGTTKVEIKYDRDYYTVTFDVKGGINGPEPIYARYGTVFEAKDIKEPKRPGYEFLGWEPLLSDTVTITGNVTYVAQWQAEKGQADYTIVLWGQNANDDQYSYLGSHEAWGNVDKEVTWNEGTLISHVHTDECWKNLTCGKVQHTHSEACLNCSHTHDMSCYGGINAENPIDADIREFANLFGSLQNGYIYRVRCNAGSIAGNETKYDKYYLYFNGIWYLASATACDGGAVKESADINAHDHSGYIFSGDDKDHFWAYKAKLSCTHTHTDACYACGKAEHTHNNTCGSLICGLSDTPKKYMSNIKPDSKLWEYERSDTVTVNADGSTVLNVYFTRKVFKLQFRKRNSSNNDFGTIEARWGKNIKVKYDEIVNKAGSSFWSENKYAEGPYTNYIGVMPQRDITYYRHESSGSGTSTMTYYGEDLNGDYQMIFTISFKGTNYTVTDEDRYQFEGYTFDHGTANGQNCNGAEFYYKRNSYALEFYSANKNTPDKTENPKYEEPLGKYYYRPVEKPTTVEPDAVFVGWYLNPECTGEEYDISAHTMPANNIALYAKWVNGLYTVRTYTDDALVTPYTYEGYSGVQGNIEKYTLATAPTNPKKDGCVFVGWFYKDGEAEKPFSFTMPITRDYNLYPKFDDQVSIEYTVHYYKTGTTDKVADDKVNTVKIGTTVTEKAKMGTELNLLSEVMQKKYYPAKTSTSEVIKAEGQEIIFYYTEAASVKYTVYYQDANGNNLKPSATKTTEYSTVTEPYLPIDGYAPHQFSITKDMSTDPEQNKIVFIYYPTLTTLNIRKTGFDAADAGTTFIFRIKGTDENTKDIDLRVTIHGYVMGDHVPNVTVADLPVGSYTVTEESDWSWRYQPTNGEQTQTITLDPDGAKNVMTFENERKDGQWLSGDAYNNNLYKPDSN